MSTPPVAALVVAAGASRRLGRPKQLEPWGEETLLEHVLSGVRRLEVGEIWLVLGANVEEIESRLDLSGCTVVENPEWEEGLASSLRVGLDAILRLSRAELVVLVMGDQPELSPEVVSKLLSAHRSSGRPAAVPRYRYMWGHPIVFERSLWPRLMSLEGDQGAKRLLQAHPDWVTEVLIEQPPPRDIDTEIDVEDMRPRDSARGPKPR
jgi:molybdenum cofactor cytidylyltransferase